VLLLVYVVILSGASGIFMSCDFVGCIMDCFLLECRAPVCRIINLVIRVS
jgi:hypothetical protein